MPQTDLSKFAANMQKTYGNRAAPSPRKLEVVSSGSLTIDHALRLGGWPRGRMIEIVGPPDVAKTLIAINSMREQQKKYPRLGVAYVDMEKTFDYDWAQQNGLDCSAKAEEAGRWQHLHPVHSEDASDMARACCASGLFSLVVVDSIGGMESKKAFVGPRDQIKSAEDDIVAANAKVITRMVKHIASLAWETGTTVLLINQHRAIIGLAGNMSAGPKAMQHSTSVKLEMKRGKADVVKMTFEDDAEPEEVAVQIEARVKRSKIFPPGGLAQFWVNNRDTPERGPAGIDKLEEYVKIGVRTGAIKRSGGWYQVPTTPQVQGVAAVSALLRERPELMEKIRDIMFSGEAS